MTAKPGVATPLTRKLSRVVTLAPGEIGTLNNLQSTTRIIRRNREIITKGRKYDTVFILIDGASIRCRILHDGRRQLLNIALPGDLIVVSGAFSERALYSITALSDCGPSGTLFATAQSVRQGTEARRGDLLVFCLRNCDVRRASDRCRATIGAGTGRGFLLELLTRLQVIGLPDERSFRMPLTQELMGDALGLSLPHVNRTLRQLRDDELVSIQEHVAIINDVEALSALADFSRSYLEPFCLPA